MVEILCGILGGAQFGPFVRQWKTMTQVANLVSPREPGFTLQCSIAVRAFTLKVVWASASRV